MANAKSWTGAEEALLGTHFDDVVAKGLRCSSAAVYARRRLLKIAAFAPRRTPPRRWGTTELAMLGRYSDREVARITGRSRNEVQAKRLEFKNSDR
jgi:hypothetical protein